MRILVVEDENKVGRFISDGLKEAAYTPTLARTKAQASNSLAQSTYDVIILDLGLPDGDGLELLSEWRKSGFDEPVIILSARDGLHDRLRGLNVGADDYLSKPFSFEELLARVRCITRRTAGRKSTTFEHRGITMDLVTRTVTRGGRSFSLTAREFALLELFMQNPGRVLSRTTIAERIWDSYSELDTNLLDVYMARLRRKLEVEGEPPIFKTLRGVGYQLQ